MDPSGDIGIGADVVPILGIDQSNASSCRKNASGVSIECAAFNKFFANELMKRRSLFGVAKPGFTPSPHNEQLAAISTEGA